MDNNAYETRKKINCQQKATYATSLILVEPLYAKSSFAHDSWNNIFLV